MGLTANVTWDPWPRSSPQLNEIPEKAFVVITKKHSLYMMRKQFNSRGGSYSD